MKKIVLTLGLVILLVGSVLGGLALHANASAPTLKAWGSSAPGTVTITGNGWSVSPPASAVALYMDAPGLPPTPPIPAVYEVAVATPGSNGVFVATFTVGPTSVGVHNITAVQGANSVTAPFTITNTSQIIDYSNIIGAIGIIQGSLNNVPVIDTDRGSYNITSAPWTRGLDFDYDGKIKHVSLTLSTSNMTGTMNVLVLANVGYHGAPLPLVDIITHAGVHMYEFDTNYWAIKAQDPDHFPFMVDYTITTLAKP